MDEPTPIIDLADEQPDNLLSQLAEKRRAIAEAREVDIPVPGYDKTPPKLLIRYRLLEGQELTQVADRMRQAFKNRYERQINAAAETMVAAVTGLYVDLDDGSPPSPLMIKGEAVTGFSAELAEALGFADKIDDPARPRDVVFGLFGNNDVMLGQHNFQLNRWMSDTTTDVSQELFGGNF
jgi:hypothetical protein